MQKARRLVTPGFPNFFVRAHPAAGDKLLFLNGFCFFTRRYAHDTVKS